MGKVKDEKDMGKGEGGTKGKGRAWGRSEGGWILGKDGFYRVDPKWVSENPSVQPSLDKGPTPVIDVPKSDVMGSVRAAPATDKAKRAKKKVVKVSSETTLYEKQAMSRDGQVGGLARARAALEKDGYGLFPVSFNTLHQTSGDPVFTAAVDGLQQCNDGITFKLKTTKTIKFLKPDSSEVSWEAIKVARPRGKSSFLPQGSKTPTNRSVQDGKTGSILPDAPVPQYNSKMSKVRKDELKCQKEAFNDSSTYLKSWPEKQARTGKSKCGFWGRRRSRKEKAEKEEDVSVKEEEMKAKAKKEVWCEGWRRIKEEKVRLADEREEEEMAREREKQLPIVSPLDLDAQVLITMMTMTMTLMMIMMMMHHQW